jgi:hypothetical protein
MFLQNLGTHSPDYLVPQPRTPPYGLQSPPQVYSLCTDPHHSQNKGYLSQYNDCLQVESRSFDRWKKFCVHHNVHRGCGGDGQPLPVCTGCCFRLEKASGVYRWRRDKWVPVTMAWRRDKWVPVTMAWRRDKWVPVTTASRRDKWVPVTTAWRRDKWAPVTTELRRDKWAPVTMAWRRDKWVLVTTAWRVLRLRMEERPPDMEGSCECTE